MNQTKIKQTKFTASKPSSTTYESLQKLQMSLPLLPGTDFNLHKQVSQKTKFIQFYFLPRC